MPSPPIRHYALSPHNAGLHVRDGRIVMPDGAPRRKVVVINGAGGASALRVPYDRSDIEIWSINNFWNCARDSRDRLRADIWWEQHQITPDVGGPHGGQPIQDPNDMAWINSCPVPLYTTQPWPANPNAVVWDIQYFTEKYGRDYWACTFAMQIAEAIEVGFEEIQIYGLALLQGTKREATFESSNVAYWLGRAEGMGIRVVVPPDDLILQHPYRYGHQYWLEADWVLKHVAQWDERKAAV